MPVRAWGFKSPLRHQYTALYPVIGILKYFAQSAFSSWSAWYLSQMQYNFNDLPWRYKIERAKIHSREFANGLQDYATGEPSFRLETTNKADGSVVDTLRMSRLPSPMLACILGDAFHNLRAALDYRLFTF